MGRRVVTKSAAKGANAPLAKFGIASPSQKSAGTSAPTSASGTPHVETPSGASTPLVGMDEEAAVPETSRLANAVVDVASKGTKRTAAANPEGIEPTRQVKGWC